MFYHHRVSASNRLCSVASPGTLCENENPQPLQLFDHWTSRREQASRQVHHDLPVLPVESLDPQCDCTGRLLEVCIRSSPNDPGPAQAARPGREHCVASHNCARVPGQVWVWNVLLVAVVVHRDATVGTLGNRHACHGESCHHAIQCCVAEMRHHAQVGHSGCTSC